MKEFKILDAVKNSDGNYDITNTLQTNLEGRGLVVVEFRCLDENGSEVDRFGGAFKAQIKHGALKRRKQQFPVKQHALSL